METTQLYHRNTIWPFYKHAPITPHPKEHQKLLHQITWLLILAGVGLRLFHYFDNRSLWTDEIYLSVSLVRMNYLELAAPLLDYEQKAPIGFLWLVRTSVLLFGKGEMALRLVPLLAGIASLLLFLPLCRHFLKPLGVAVAVGIMALAPPLIYHSVEIKQYGFDLFITIVAIHLYIRFRRRTDTQALIIWGISGAALYWFSFTTPFVLTSIAMGVALTYFIKKDWFGLFRSIIPFSIWMVSFAANYFAFTGDHADATWLVTFFKYYSGFMPFPPTSGQEASWFWQTPYKLLYYPLGLLWNASPIESGVWRNLLKLPIIGMFFLLVGLVSFRRRNKEWLLILCLTIFFHLLASGLELYPFSERFLVYATPYFLLLIGRGVDTISSWLPTKKQWQFVLPLLVIAGPMAGAALQVANPDYLGGYKNSKQREGLLFVNQNFQPGDAVYVYWNSIHTYQYYKTAYNLRFDAQLGKDHRWQSTGADEYLSRLVSDVAALQQHPRVWVIYNNELDIDIGDDITKLPHWYVGEIKGGEKLRAYVGALGPEIKHYQNGDASVNLFQMTPAIKKNSLLPGTLQTSR